MTSLRSVTIAAIAAFFASTALAADPRPAEPAADTSDLSSTRTANDMVVMGGTAASLNGGHYDWENVSPEQRAMHWPTDESGSRAWGFVIFGSAILMFVLTILGLTLTFRSLRAEMRRNRLHYRPRGPGPRREIA